MKTIEEQKKNIALLWKQRKPEQAVYRPMKFLLKARVKDGLLLYNVVTSEMVLLDSGEAKYFDSSTAAYDRAMDELIARHFLVPEGFDENKSVQQLRSLIKKLEPSKRVSGFTILPTTECNARCYYCFESDHKRCTLTKKMADDVVEYIVDMCKGEPIQIEWFGGEPLVAHQRISQICASLKQREIKFQSSMVSNAYLFNDNLVRTARRDWNLSSIQITLDGTELIYNETKAYVSPQDNPYQRVLQNIGCLLENEIMVNIRLNVTDKNYDDLNYLIDELAERFGGKKGFTCYSHAVYEGMGYDPLTYGSWDLVDSQTIRLDTKLREKGLLGSLGRLPSLKVNHCMADNDSARLIYPDGTIGKCENQPSWEGIGDIYCDITDKEKEAWYKAVEESPICNDCCLYPDCFDLKPCPEAGKCSSARQHWKMDRYSVLMSERYLKSKKDEKDVKTEDSTQIECES